MSQRSKDRMTLFERKEVTDEWKEVVKPRKEERTRKVEKVEKQKDRQEEGNKETSTESNG
eukprot:4028079-Ditylum_brightwellii.AAC.1